MATREALVATQEEALASMWEAHRESVRRLLLALARDMDVADDLLQETYLHARAGFTGYHGGDARAWLAAIARNVYASHARQRRVRAEVPAEHPEHLEVPAPVDVLGLLIVRRALAELPAPFRTALVMKHYAGYTYQEIARHQHCPVGTAKWRVSEALERLRAALGRERRAAMASCVEAHEMGLVDCVYGVLPEAQAAKVRAHLAECAKCREEAEELAQVVRLLDAIEGERKNMHFIELDGRGGMTLYAVGTMANDTGEALQKWEFQSEVRPDRMYQEGEEISVKVVPNKRFGDRNLVATLHHPVPPGGPVSLLSVHAIPSGHPYGVEAAGDGRFRLRWKQGPSSNLEFAYVQVVRLPSGATLLSADPTPGETRRDAATTLIWRRVLPPAVFFECVVEYQV